METLDSLAYTLNHIFLEDRKIRTYQIAETNDSLMVAEPETPYGKTPNDICPIECSSFFINLRL